MCFSSKAPASATLKLSDLGTPYRADVKAVPKPGGRAKSFKLDRIELTNNTAGSDPFRFPYTSKGSVGDDDIAYVQQVAMLNHTLYLYTAADGGDFSGPAFVTLECENGETEEVALLDSEGNKPTFTVGCTYLNIRTYDLGKVTGVKVSPPTLLRMGWGAYGRMEAPGSAAMRRLCALSVTRLDQQKGLLAAEGRRCCPPAPAVVQGLAGVLLWLLSFSAAVVLSHPA